MNGKSERGLYMNKLHVHYGPRVLDLEIPEGNLEFELRPKKVDINEDPQSLVNKALHNPIGTPQLKDMVTSGMKVIILADDRTRLTPQRIIIPKVLEELNSAGVPDSQIQVLIAYGTHRKMNPAEILEKFGNEIVNRIEILHHDCLDMSNLIEKGTTSRGTKILVNKDFLDADFRIGIGGILPHHPTGWSGGAKILLPGIAGQETVTAMHLLGATEQQLGNIETPCRQEMEDFAKSVGLHFIINVLNDSSGTLLRVVAGHFIQAHRKGVEYGKELYGAPFFQKADITLSSTYPCGDYDLTQADKGLFSAELATNKGGEIILMSPCPEGIAPTHGDEMASLASFSDAKLWKMLENDQIKDRFCASECMYLNHIKNNFRATLMMDPLLTNIMGFQYLGAEDLQRYLDYRLKLNPQLKIGVIHESSDMLPLEMSERRV